jgi:LmbE family N-acetylglucosaminyl deacetylase
VSRTTGVSWGLLEPGVLERVLVISPHLDDAALGAAELIASYPGMTVLTVFAGAPPHYPDPPTAWDSSGGFRAGDDVAALRRVEDARAMDVLGAQPRWLDFVDHQYLARDERPLPSAVAPVVAEVIGELTPSAVFFPLGLANPDHGVTHEAVMPARTDMTGAGEEPAWFCYQDAGYCHIPGMVAWRIGKLFRSNAWPTPAVVPVRRDPERKRSAILAYTSQLPPLRAEHSLDERLAAEVPEQFWRVAPPPAGWEVLAEAP